MIVEAFAFCVDESSGSEMGLAMAVDFGVRFTLTCDADYLHMFLDASEDVRHAVDVPTSVWKYWRRGWPDDWESEAEQVVTFEPLQS